MAKLIQAAEFFVVGGPVQPDRPCYVERPAEHVLEIALQSQRCCCVLGPRASGKSSLMGRVARALRQRGGLTAVVDLAQIGARGDDADPDRWAYGIAHRVAHELRLTTNLREWWEEQGSFESEQRLADFFWDVVLTNTTADVTVFVDEIEQALKLPYGTELLAAIDACYARRAAEPDYARLNFVVLGVATLEQLASSPASAFASATLIELPDFVTDQAYQLAIGFGGEPAHAQALMDRVLAWTGGHPYLTQKIARGVARKAGRLEDVEHIVTEQLLAPAASRAEPLLAHMRSLLTQRQPAARRALRLLKSLAAGKRVSISTGPDVQAAELLRLSGVVTVTDERLAYRNRLFKELFGRRWVRSVQPTSWLTWGAAAALIAAVAVGGYFWYAQFLPQPYIRALGSPNVSLAIAAGAYERLRALPGFAEEADRLYTANLEQRGEAAASLDAFKPVAAALRALPDGAVMAERLEGALWLKRTGEAERAEQRDAAIVLAERAVATGAPAAPATLAALVGDDYPLLIQTQALAATPETWSVDFASHSLVLLDANRHIAVQAFADPKATVAAGAVEPIALTALEPRPLVREITVDEGGSAGAFTLELDLAHPAPNDLLVTLTAPSGMQANLALPAQNAEGKYAFVANAATPLAALTDEERRGVWQLTLVDRRADNAGALDGWQLKFGDDKWDDAPGEPIPIPDPLRTDKVSVTVDEGGTHALVAPLEPGKIGAVALWNLATAELQSDFTLPAPPRFVAVNSTATRVAAVSGSALTLWNAVDALPVARLATQTEFVLPPAFSTDGDYFVIAEQVETTPLVSLLRAEDGSLLASIEGVAGVRDWYLGPGARYLVLRVSPRVLRVIDPRRGTELAVLRQGRELRRVEPLASGARVLTIDAGGVIKLWDIGAARAGAVAPRALGLTADIAGVSVAADGSRLAYTAADGSVEVVALPSGARVCNLRLPRTEPFTRSRLAGDGAELVTASGNQFRRWQLPPSAQQTAPPPVVRADVTALAVVADADTPVAGFASGQLRIPGANGAGELDYFGHAGPVESVAVAADRSRIVTGGADGALRLWSFADGAPVGLPMQATAEKPASPIVAVALSADGRWAAGAGGSAVRLWQVAGGVLQANIDVADGPTAIDFSPDNQHLAIADRAGLFRVAELDGPVTTARMPLDAPIRGLAVAPGGEIAATGDDAGRVQLWRMADATPIGSEAMLPARVRWVGFSPDGSTLFAVTDMWVHRYAVSPTGLVAIDASLPALRLMPAAFAAVDEARLRVAGITDAGALAVEDVNLTSPPALAGEASTAAGRDWATVLGLGLDDSGNVVATGR